MFDIIEPTQQMIDKEKRYWEVDDEKNVVKISSNHDEYTQTYVSDDGSEYQDARQEIGNDEQIFRFILGRGSLADGREGESWPIKAIDVLPSQWSVLGSCGRFQH